MALIKFPPTMSSDTAPSPYVASGATIYSSFAAWRLFDGLLDNDSPAAKFSIITGTSGYWQLDIGISQAWILDNYTIKNVNFGGGYPTRVPKDWTMQGSNNGTNWTTIDTVTSQTSWGEAESRNFICDTRTTAYRYFKIVVTANNGDASYTEIGELEFYYEDAPMVMNNQFFVMLLAGGGR